MPGAPQPGMDAEPKTETARAGSSGTLGSGDDGVPLPLRQS